MSKHGHRDDHGHDHDHHGCGIIHSEPVTRREALRTMGAGFGMMARLEIMGVGSWPKWLIAKMKMAAAQESLCGHLPQRTMLQKMIASLGEV